MASATFADPRIAAHLRFMDGQLAQSEWFAGSELTGADIMMSFPCEASAKRSNLAEFTYVQAFLDKVHARPAYQRALERGGPYALLG
jgi:glutathione S-transferase